MSQQSYALVMSTNIGGQFAANIMHWVFEDSGYNSTFAAASALVSRWIAVAFASFQNITPVGTTFLSIKARRVSAVGGFEFTDTFAPATTGNRSGTLSVAATGPVINLYQSANGTKRGRIFIPGISEDDADLGQIGSSLTTAIQTAIPNLINNMVLVGGGAPTAKLVIYRHQNHSWVDVGSANQSMKIGTQRRRQLPA